MLKFISISAKNEIIKRNYEKKITIHNFFLGLGWVGGYTKLEVLTNIIFGVNQTN